MSHSKKTGGVIIQEKNFVEKKYIPNSAHSV